MADIYVDSAKMVAEMLQPSSTGALGQGVVTLTRLTPGTVNPVAPWEPVAPTSQTETLKAAVSGVSSRLVGVAAGETVILASDRECICAVPAMAYIAGDVLTVDGKPVHIVAVRKYPDAGTTSAVKFIIRG